MTIHTLILNNELIPITNLFNEFGEEVYKWEDAFVFVAGPLPNGNWMSDLCEYYDQNFSQ